MAPWHNHGFRLVHFGEEHDLIVPGDYDGDGRSDIAVTRDQGGVIVWHILSSRWGHVTYSFGDAATDLETPADYDGDGRTDLSVW